MVIGGVGALIGTKAIAPIFLSAASAPGEVTLPFVVVAAGAAAALLVLSHMLHQKFGVAADLPGRDRRAAGPHRRRARRA